MMARRPRRCRTAPQTSGRRRIARTRRDRRARGRRAIAGKLLGIRVIIAFEGRLWASIKGFHYSFSLLPGWARVRSRRVGGGESTLITSLTWLSFGRSFVRSSVHPTDWSFALLPSALSDTVILIVVRGYRVINLMITTCFRSLISCRTTSFAVGSMKSTSTTTVNV